RHAGDAIRDLAGDPRRGGARAGRPVSATSQPAYLGRADGFSGFGPGAIRRNLRLASGLVLFTYITLHLANHALGLVSLDVAETALRVTVAMWHSLPGTILLYGPFAIHFLLA